MKYEPVFLGFLCDDPFKIVAHHPDAVQINTLYHFGGLSSRQVVRIVAARNPSWRTELLNPSALSHLLFSWPNEVALLLKEPLASIYCTIAKKEVHVLGNVNFPVCLLASRQYLESKKDEILRVYKCLRFLTRRAKSEAGEFVELLYSFRLEEDLLRFILPRGA